MMITMLQTASEVEGQVGGMGATLGIMCALPGIMMLVWFLCMLAEVGKVDRNDA